MKDFPTDPMRQHARFMAAFCDDLLAGDYHAPRAKAVCEISKQLADVSTAQGAGVPASPSGSRPSDRASKAVSPPDGAPIPNARKSA